MKSMIATAAVLTALLMLVPAAQADSKFRAVVETKHRHHAGYDRYDRYDRQPHYRYRDRHRTRYTDRAYRYRDRAHPHHSRYRRGYEYRHGYRTRLGDGIYLSPRGLTIYFDGRYCD